MNVLLCLKSLVIGEALHEILRKNDDCIYCIANDSGQEYLESPPDVIIADRACLGRDLLTRYPEAKVILLDSGMQQDELTTLVLLYKLNGIISINDDCSLMIKAIKLVHEGQIWLDGKCVKAVLNRARSMYQKGTVDYVSKREQEIIDLISKGKRNKDIAADLFVSEQTVKAHISSIFKKFNVASRNQLMSLLMRHYH
jgi:DNA-binding NarL/FixJ family response regulator